MDELAEQHSQSDIRSIFLYTHEAHPGENIPHLTGMQQKFDHARQFKESVQLRRPIMLDSLDGACHRAYGSMPNMTWIFDRTGRVVYKAPWTAVRSVASALEYLEKTRELRSKGIRVAPLQIERMDYRFVDQEAFYRGLERNGPKALREFQEAGL